MAEFETVTESGQVELEPEILESPENGSLPQPAEPSKGQKFLAGVKEWLRKFTVKLKHKTHMIPLVIVLISSLVYLCSLNTLSIALNDIQGIDSAGICMFVNTLVSILVLLVFLNAFPKRKKPNIVMLVGVFVLLGLLLALDLVFYFKVVNFAEMSAKKVFMTLDEYYAEHPMIIPALNKVILHVIFVGISILALAFLPLYKMGINKINTRKVLAENEIKEEIDTSAEV